MTAPRRRLRAVVLALVFALLPSLALSSGAGEQPDPSSGGDRPTLEKELLQRYAPVVLLAPGERAMPANVDWFLARAKLEADPAPRPHMTQASLVGDLDGMARLLEGRVARLRPNLAARPGSREPRDWKVYGHVYAAKDGGTLVQYWFFYPFNDFHVLFDHEGDWEHVTVKLDASLQPRGAWYARHDWSAPGKWFVWGELAREGDHPVVLSARGSHASYANGADARFYDRVCPTSVPADARASGCEVWRTWAEDTGGVVETGERGRPATSQVWFLRWPGLWGVSGAMGRDSGGPPGPAFQEGWCSEGAPGCS